MKNILYISYDGMTDPLGQSQVLPYLSGLAAQGYSIRLMSFEKKERFSEGKEYIQRWCTNAGIDWFPQQYTKRPPLISTLWDVLKMKQVARRLHAKKSIDIVHCRSYIAALAGLFMKRKYGCRFLFDMRGFWADERIDGGIWKLSNPLFRVTYRYFKRKEIQFLQEADHVVSLTEAAKKEMQQWEKLAPHQPPITVIPCCVDLERFNPRSISESDQQMRCADLGISQDDFILGYVGSIGTWYMLPEMLDYFRELKSDKQNARFLFVTNESAETIRDEAAKKGIDKHDILITTVPHKDVPLMISLFDLSIFFIRSTYSKKASSPTKQGEIMAMGVPLVCNAGVGDTDEIVRRFGSGTVLSEFSQKEYAKSFETKSFSSEHIIAGAHDYFSLERGVKSYADIYEKLGRNG